MLEIEILAAGSGQSLRLTYGRSDAPLHVLIDCGPAPAARAIQNWLDELPPDQRRLEGLLVLTHVDADRIGGAIPLLSNEKLAVQCRDPVDEFPTSSSTAGVPCERTTRRSHLEPNRAWGG